MSQVALWFSARTGQHPNFGVPRLMKRLALFYFALALSMCMGTPASAQPSLSLWPNPVYVGDTVYVAVIQSNTCNNGENSINNSDYPTVDNLSMSWDYYEVWTNGEIYSSGTATASSPGALNITAYDSCYNAIDTEPLTVVQLNDNIVISGPANSGWTDYTGDANRDYLALQSPSNGDVILFGVTIIPSNTLSASLVTWTNASAVSPGLTATMPATSAIGPLPVNAVCCGGIGGTTPGGKPAPQPPTPINSWIFTGTISYHTQPSDKWDSSDSLSFKNVSPPLSPNRQPGNTTSWVAVKGNNYYYCMDECEIIGTLAPPGIGTLLNADAKFPGVTFNTQLIYSNSWSGPGSYLSSAPPDVTSGGFVNDSPLFSAGGTQQASPIVNDKVFAIDAPGIYFVNPITNSFGAVADNFQDYISLVGGKAISPVGLWFGFVQVEWLIGQTGVSGSQVKSGEGSGNITLPATWGAFAQ